MKTSKITKCLKKLGSKKLKLGKFQDLIFNIDKKEVHQVTTVPIYRN